MRENTSKALYLGVVGGIAYVQVLLLFYGHAMTWQWPTDLIQSMASSPHMRVVLTSAVLHLVMIFVIILPTVWLMLRRIRSYALITASIASVTALTYAGFLAGPHAIVQAVAQQTAIAALDWTAQFVVPLIILWACDRLFKR